MSQLKWSDLGNLHSMIMRVSIKSESLADIDGCFATSISVIKATIAVYLLLLGFETLLFKLKFILGSLILRCARNASGVSSVVF